MKKLLALTLALVTVLTVFSGCNAMKLNEEKDNARTVAVINGEKITKKEFRDYLNYYYVYYEIYGYTLPSDEKSEDEFISGMYDSFMLMNLLKCEAESLKLNEKAAEDEAYSFDAAANTETFIQTAVAEKGSDEAFDEVLAKYSFTRESFTTVAESVISLQNYSTLFFDYGLDTCDIASGEALNVNGRSVPLGYIYWYAVNYIIQYYYSYGTLISADSDILSVFDTVIEEAKKACALMDYAKENNITITDDELEAGKTEADMLYYYAGETTMLTYYHNYLVNDEMRAAAAEFFGTYYALSDKLSSLTKETISPTDDELTEYYVENVKTYDESTVSAYHILTKDKDFYDALVAEIGTTGEGFMAAYEKYTANKDEKIVEIADLGAIGRGQMVTEFETAVFNANVGDVVSGVETTYGYHVIYVYAKNGSTPSLADIREKVLSDYITEKTTEKVTEITDSINKDLKFTLGDYKKIPNDILFDSLKDKYNAKLYVKVALAR